MNKSDDAVRFLILIYFVSGLFTKLISEIVHELLGHGLFVILFGGQISNVYISILWPYELSHINWILPSLQQWELAWVYGGGILATGIMTLMIQLMLIVKKPRWEISVFLAWIAFWSLINAGGYLIIGSVYPFGDVEQLLSLGVISSQISLVMGSLLVFLGFVTLSYSWQITLRPIIGDWAPAGYVMMWSVLPIIVWLAMVGLGMFSWTIFMMGFIPPIVSLIFAGIQRRKPDNGPDKMQI
jgi:hypothetical protein